MIEPSGFYLFLFSIVLVLAIVFWKRQPHCTTCAALDKKKHVLWLIHRKTGGECLKHFVMSSSKLTVLGYRVVGETIELQLGHQSVTIPANFSVKPEGDIFIFYKGKERKKVDHIKLQGTDNALQIISPLWEVSHVPYPD